MGVYFPETCTGNHRRHALHLSWAELTLLDRLSQPDIPQFTATGSGMSFDMSKLWFRKKNTQVGNIFVLYSTSINWVPSMYLVLGYILVWVGPERRKNNKKSGRLAPGVSLSWLERHPVMEGLWVQSLVWACAWLVGLIPLLGLYDPLPECVREPNDWCFSLASVIFSLPSSLSESSDKMSLGDKQKSGRTCLCQQESS